jgi:hypothetical protein
MGPIWGVAMNEINRQLLWDPICKYCNECKNQWLLWDPICGYCNECKNQRLLWDFICEYCIFENGLMEVIIKNDVGIICLKCVYYFKSF